MKFVLATTCLLAVMMGAQAANWAVIVAGSQGYGNYRHQADACHAYQIVKKNGIPESNIILMAQDDIANNQENPFPGKMFNKPTPAGTPGVDVYNGCNIDYRGDIVTAKLFLDVLQGNQAAVNALNATSTKVLKSGPNDKVFVNFADHGGQGLIAFPNGPYLYSKDLISAIKNMHSKSMYKKLVFYMEACNSGSMFDGVLTADLNVYATTAANPNEPSWGTYCMPNDKVDGKEINSCLGDLYSVNWMEDSDTATGQKETLEAQYTKVKGETASKSHVMEYGDMSFKNTDDVHDYQGAATVRVMQVGETPRVAKDGVDSRDIALVTKFYKYLRATAGQRAHLATDLISEITHRENMDSVFAKIAHHTGDHEALTAFRTITQHDCQKQMNDYVEKRCGAFSDYSLKYTTVVSNLCESQSIESIKAAVNAAC